jgi:hypothetical protein
MSNGQHKVVTIVTEEYASSIFMTDEDGGSKLLLTVP